MGGFAALALLSGCGGGVEAPAAVSGTWGSDCGQPYVKFDGGKMTVFPDKTTYDLTSATVANGQLDVGYVTSQGLVSETYLVQGSTLQLDHGTYAGTQATWHKAPMSKCS